MTEFFATIFGCVVSGFLAWYCAKIWNRNTRWISIGALIVGIGLSLLISGLATPLQWSHNQEQKITFQQYLNGVETKVETMAMDCTKDGICRYTYRCPPFSETYTVTDKKGHPQTKTRSVYHYCPYVKQELNFVIHTTVGDELLEVHRFPVGYQRWDPFEVIPESVVQDAGVGEPPEVKAAREALARNDPRGATTIAPYVNYVLPSDDPLLKVNSSQLEHYQKAKLLPALSTTTELDQARKVQTVGLKLSNMSAWQEALMRVNMDAGSLQPPSTRFDIQVVLVNNHLIPEMDANEYTRALNAAWEDTEIYETGALPKNMVVIVAASDGHTVTWARGFTLLPGNNTLWQDIETPAPIGLPGTRLTPQDLIGWPIAILGRQRNGDITFQRVQPSQGAIERLVVLGPHHFVRQPASKFSYLAGQLQPDAKTIIGFLFLTWLPTAVIVNLWYLLVFVKQAN